MTAITTFNVYEQKVPAEDGDLDTPSLSLRELHNLDPNAVPEEFWLTDTEFWVDGECYCLDDCLVYRSRNGLDRAADAVDKNGNICTLVWLYEDWHNSVCPSWVHPIVILDCWGV